MQNYKIDILTYQANGSVKSDCSDIAFQNNGLVSIQLNNGFILPPNNFISFTANEGELDNTIYTFTFINSLGTFQNKLTVIRKVYI